MFYILCFQLSNPRDIYEFWENISISSICCKVQDWLKFWKICLVPVVFNHTAEWLYLCTFPTSLVWQDVIEAYDYLWRVAARQKFLTLRVVQSQCYWVWLKTWTQYSQMHSEKILNTFTLVIFVIILFKCKNIGIVVF